MPSQSTKVFWWPFSGGWGDHEVAVVGRGWWNLLFELLGLLALVWVWRAAGLSDKARRHAFVHTGQLADVR